MSERPILFSGPMVRAILGGRKTQTRRVVKWPVLSASDGAKRRIYTEADAEEMNRLLTERQRSPLFQFCPYGQPGDRLWVRESHWRFTGCEFRGKPWDGFRESPTGDPFDARCYDSDVELVGQARMAAAALRVPSIHMPRWASRLTLDVVAVRVERLQEISDNDCEAEGVRPSSEGDPTDWRDDESGWRRTYRQLWDSINAKRGHSWDSNPWVWVIEFAPLGSESAGKE